MGWITDVDFGDVCVILEINLSNMGLDLLSILIDGAMSDFVNLTLRLAVLFLAQFHILNIQRTRFSVLFGLSHHDTGMSLGLGKDDGLTL